ncbi:hypothetical protein BEWA_034090 [Theileria equi strain WA]|uniref:A-kinase anchor protein 7-like phosphoesterase domain-containing protein n=1 Tax=Theileria equi strain WA TaxID=1537102 RepID=L0AY94_THEEQ|nr:hypothetical protein BEWA_034090 [Theileria equi strain WA]AFZ80552.1 hypothetical protein BEWA_034090 [Theileria equi strain WA]|eukprot:XP_004830218.1 hypothetical protein BEWA_034090 [Theileria equi strain WA]
MSDITCDEFSFETKAVRQDGVKGNPYVTYRIPKPSITHDQSDHTDSGFSPVSNSQSQDVKNDDTQYAVGVREPFKAFINQIIPHIEKLFKVRMSLQQLGDEYQLIATGDKAEASVNEVLNRCRKSNVYNFYLCFPVRGKAFHRNFTEFQNSLAKILGPNTEFIKRPHITLAMLNLVTDSDIDAVVRDLQITSLTIKSIPKKPSTSQTDGFLPYSVNLHGLDTVVYKGKFAHRSVLMANATLEKQLLEIAKEFQNTVNKSINNIITHNNPSNKKKRPVVGENIGMLTGAQLAAKGISIASGGNVEVGFTDVNLMDRNGVISHEETEKLLNSYGTNQSGMSNITPDPVPSYEVQDENDQSCTDNIEYDTAVKNKFHVTLLRHQGVSALKDSPFDSDASVVCVELRPRNSETCNFSAYTTTELTKFTGNRFDNIKTDEPGVSQIALSQAPNIPNDHIVDVNTTETDNKSERFVFWI